MLSVTRTHAVATPKSCQDRKVAAKRDACSRRDIRVAFFRAAQLGFGQVVIGVQGSHSPDFASMLRNIGPGQRGGEQCQVLEI